MQDLGSILYVGNTRPVNFLPFCIRWVGEVFLPKCERRFFLFLFYDILSFVFLYILINAYVINNNNSEEGKESNQVLKQSKMRKPTSEQKR